MIKIKQLSAYISGHAIVNNFSLKSEKGSINAIIGPNGCGKTTLLKALCGLLKAEGLVYIDDKLFIPQTNKHYYIAAFLEGGSYYLNMNIVQNLNYACLLNGIDKSKINKAIALVDFPSTHLNTKASKLSLGQRQKLGLAMVLILERPVLLLDEPLNGLDIDAVDSFNELLLKIKSETETTILLTSHLVAKLTHVTDTISILKDGLLKYQFESSELGKIRFMENKTQKIFEFLQQNKILHTETKNGILIKEISENEVKNLVKSNEIDKIKFSTPTLEELYKYTTV